MIPLTVENRQRIMSALMPVARRAVDRGEHPTTTPIHTARIVADYATTDLLLKGRTLLLPLDEVNEALGMDERRRVA